MQDPTDRRTYHLALPSRAVPLGTLLLAAVALAACHRAPPPNTAEPSVGATPAPAPHVEPAPAAAASPDPGAATAAPPVAPPGDHDAEKEDGAASETADEERAEIAAPEAAAATEQRAAEPVRAYRTSPRRDARAPVRKPSSPSSLDDLLDNSLSGGDNKRVARGRKSPAKLKAQAFGLGGVGNGYGGGALAARSGHPQQIAAPSTLPAIEHNTEGYAHISENPFHQVADKPLSTFSIDVDTASYSNVRRFLSRGSLPPADAVRIEEMINYFSYQYEAPRGPEPFSVNTEVSVAPWNPKHRLVHVGLKGREVADENVPARNLVFLLDVSGSMNSPDKLPLLKHGMGMLARQLRPQDRIAIVVYAGASGMVLEPVSGAEQGRILAALEQLQAGGSTNGASGIQLAYDVAQQGFIRGGINRVILATDGDFNVGVTSHGDLTRLIENKRKSGVFLTVLGFGTGNLKDSTMETLADKGNGNYAYIDSEREAHKVLVREAGSTLVTIAKDVKLQLEFNPSRVESYRLIGYENRVMAARDFNDDKKDAGEIGAGHTVTALYEVVPRGAGGTPEVDPLKYQGGRTLTGAAESDELLTVKLRYKHPEADKSKRLSRVVRDRGLSLEQSSENFRWSAAVAGFGMLLRRSEHAGSATLDMVMQLARDAVGADHQGDRQELLQLMKSARALGLDRAG